MKNTFDYEITCYKDCANNLGGVLYPDEHITIDFDKHAVFIDSMPSGITDSAVRFMKFIIASHPAGIDRTDLIGKYYDDDEVVRADSLEDAMEANKIRRMANLKHEINSKLGFTFITFKKGSFNVNLPKAIKKIPIKKENVYSIKELFSEEYSAIGKKYLENTEGKAAEFSAKYLNSGARTLSEKPANEVLSELSVLSSVFDYISAVDGNSATNSVRLLYDIITDECINKTNRDILKIKGPLGSYKNRIMQYLYLAVAKNNKDILPFYIDIAFYERISGSDVQRSEADIFEQINAAFDEIKEITDGCDNKVPLLFLDGIRDFSRGNESLYIRINKRIAQSDCKLIICLDADFTANVQHSFNVHPLGTNDFKHYMRISSMSLYKKKDSIAFINNCITCAKPHLKANISAETVYKHLIRLNFGTTDAYWLVYMLKTASNYILDEKSTIVDLYTAICIDILGDVNLLDSAAELAYNFEFESSLADKSDVNYDIRWKLIRKHRSVLDFLIARHYAKKVLSLKLSKENAAETSEQLRIFNMIIQGNISRFAFAILNGNDDYEHNIMKVAKEYYDKLSLIGKSELTFRMTALKNPRRKQDSIRLLKIYKEKELKFYQNIPAESIEEKKDSAFLLRSLFINLIYENDRDAFLTYFNMLLSDKLANSINRGFHLEYYGDKAFIPNKSLPDFEDNVSKGKKAFNMICLTLNERMESKRPSVYAAAIEIVSLCHLIQARIEPNPNKKIFDVSPYINTCLNYLEWIVKQPLIAELPEVLMYFNWVNNELSVLAKKSDSCLRYYPATPFNDLSAAGDIVKADWTKCGISSPENIVEHMYNCWLIALLYLPERYDVPGYDKNVILQMLLLHDLADAKTAAAPLVYPMHISKEYESEKNTVMQSLLFSGTYPCATEISTYISYWNSWHSKEGINYQTANDIEYIQSVFQFCRYCRQYPEKFRKDDLLIRLSQINMLKTDLCLEIAEKLIFNNPEFRDIITVFIEEGGNIC